MDAVHSSGFPAQEIFDAYPSLGAQLDALCEHPPWAICGVSAWLYDATHCYLEIAKPKHWRRRADGATEVGLGGIGGSLEPDEKALACLAREAQEELGVGLEITSAPRTYVVYEGRLAAALALKPRCYPRPALFTVSQNLYRQSELAYPTLAIVTFQARIVGEPGLRDLYGLAAVPLRTVWALLQQDEITLDALENWPGVRMRVQAPLPKDSVLVPVWTGRSLQRLAQAGLWL